MYYTYMLRCQDDSLYTGITTNIARRTKEHFDKNERSAKYTRTHTAEKLEAVWESDDRTLASKLEYHIKRLTKKQKERIILENCLEKFFSEKIDCEKYKRSV